MRTASLASAAALAGSLFVLVHGGCARRVDDQMVAAAAINGMRTQFNNDNCLSIYDASAVQFKAFGSKFWLRECDHLRVRMGRWQGYTIYSQRRLGTNGGTLLVELDAHFDNDSAEMRVFLFQDKGKTALGALDVRRRDTTAWQHYPPLPPGLVDPPELRSRAPSPLLPANDANRHPG